jgi:serine/threonine protein kinase/tetratricopeptide (TPR) repeat protein
MTIIGGHYEIIGDIGQGGMGTIFKGRDQRNQQIVALKLLKPEVVQQDPDMLQRFAREGEALRKLNHPNIVKMLDTIEEDSNHYIVMEYVEGGSLRDLLKKSPKLSVEQVLNIALDLSDALIRAHRLKIIHRDIKPENVLLNADGTPLLTDFGVARMNGNTDSVTQTGVIIGTLAYLPPETLQGNRIDERGDMWAFGVMLYEMLSGRRPFDGDSTAMLLSNILMTPTPDMFAYRTDVPYSVMGLVYWLLEKDRDKRPASMRLVGAMLENILNGEQLPANWFGGDSHITPTPEQITNAVREYTSNSLRLTDVPTITPSKTATPLVSSSVVDGKTLTPSSLVMPTPTTLETPTNRHPFTAPMALGLGIVAGIVFLLAFFVSIQNNTTRPNEQISATPSITVAPVAKNEIMVLIAEFGRMAGDERDANRAIVDDLRRTFEDIPISRLRIREYPNVIASDTEAVAIAEQYDALIIVWGTYDTEGADINVQLGDITPYGELLFDRATMTKLTNTQVRVSTSQRETLAYAVIQTANIFFPYYGDVIAITRTLSVLPEITAPPAQVQGRGINALFYTYLTQYASDIDGGIQTLNTAIQFDSSNPMLFMGRSLAYQRAGDPARALQDIETSKQLAPDDWTTPLFNQFNVLIYFEEDYEAGLQLVNQIIALRPDSWYAYMGRGFVYYALKRYAEAGQDFAQSIALGADDNYPYLGGTAVALRQADFALTREYLLETLRLFPDPFVAQRIFLNVFNEDTTRMFAVPLSLAFGNVILRQWSAVIESTEPYLADTATSGDLYFMRGLAYCNLDQFAESEASYTQAIALDPDYYLLYLMRAEVRRNQGDLLDATSDLGVVLASPQASQFQAIIADSNSDAVTCKTFLDYTPSNTSEATPESTP